MTEQNSQFMLKEMIPADFDIWLDYCVVEYAKDKKKAMGIAFEQALALSKNSFETSLPDGLKTQNQHLFVVLDARGENVGVIWFALKTEWGVTSAFIYDIEIKPEHRGQGAGAAAMRLIEIRAKDLGASKIALHVFGQNRVAKALYDRLGYVVTDYSMAKDLG